jgi:DNA replication protein DnaC
MKNDALEKIRSHLKILKLTVIERSLSEQLARAAREHSSPTEVLEQLLGLEASRAIERRIERRIVDSKLPERKLLSDFDFEFQTGVDKAQIMELATLGFVESKQGVILAGSSGTGKSHIAKALLLIACQKLYSCRYTTASNMLKDLLAGLADGSLDEKLKSYLRPQILLIDEVGFDRLEQEAARNASLFLKVVDGRYCKGSVIMTTNLDFKMLGDYLGDPMITTSMVDRLVHHSIIVHIEGPSWRMHESKKINNRQARKASPAKRP